jgi:hypothetical protein
MLDAFLEHPFFLNPHRQAPLLKERESFLSHLQQQGTSLKALRNLLGELQHVVRLLKLTEMRDVALEEIQQAACCWARQQRANGTPHPGRRANCPGGIWFWGCLWPKHYLQTCLGCTSIRIIPPLDFAQGPVRECSEL